MLLDSAVVLYENQRDTNGRGARSGKVRRAHTAITIQTSTNKCVSKAGVAPKETSAKLNLFCSIYILRYWALSLYGNRFFFSSLFVYSRIVWFFYVPFYTPLHVLDTISVLCRHIHYIWSKLCCILISATRCL